MKTKSKISGYLLRTSAIALLFSCVIVAFSSAINVPGRRPTLPAPKNNNAFGVNGHESSAATAAPAIPRERTLTFADRVAYQRAIEEVYWRHRIWPKENAGPRPPLDKVMSQAQIEKKVEDYLRNSQALEDYWQRPITPDQIQAEMERIASHTKQPGVLRELFAALGNDPFVIAECLARPVLAERLLTELYAHDQRFHSELKRRAEAELRAYGSAREMKQTSGMYTEIEWIKSDSAQGDSALSDTKSVDAMRMNTSEWQERVEKLARDFASAKVGRARPLGAPKRRSTDAIAEIKTGVLSPLQEDDAHYYAVAVMKKGKDRLKLATIAWLKEPLRSWLAKAEAQVPTTMAAMTADYTLPVISGESDDSIPSINCTDNTWTATTPNIPSDRYLHTAVWSGSEMIVWGGYHASGLLNTGGKYNPSTDSWTTTSTTNAPSARDDHTAVWTGSEMIVWGGNGGALGYLNTGGRYNPGTDSWRTTTALAPTSRINHTAVWTGSEMIIWGGDDGSNPFNTGGRYNPNTDSWTSTSLTNAPAARSVHTAVWTGAKMVVWGGYGNSSVLNTGGRYNPSTNSWTTTSTTNAPTARAYHTAVWSGSEMIAWGGIDAGFNHLNTGGRYNPTTDSWIATSTTNAPDARAEHTAVWTGSEMIVWGGDTGDNTGGRYNPSTDIWTVTSTTNAPTARDSHTAVWTGSQMIVWGGNGGALGYVNTGGRYNPSTDSWTATSTSNEPTARTGHTAVWTGSEMIVWGGGSYVPIGNTGGRYNPSTDSWTATSTTNAPDARENHTAVWTGSEMIVWGGACCFPGTYFNTGGRYNPSTDSWIATSTIAPSGRENHTAVWTGREMIVWGGYDGSNYLNTGGKYNPSTDSWILTGTTNAPSARANQTAVWTGRQMIVWGGCTGSPCNNLLNSGGRYNPGTDSWTATSTTNAPTARAGYTAVWTGSEMIVWGGWDLSNVFNTGGRYNPGTDSWTATSTTNAPAPRVAHTAVWTGSEMIVWGGTNDSTGGRYNPTTDSWTATSTTNAPTGRHFHTAVWSGSEMIIWGGLDIPNNEPVNGGWRYCAAAPTPTPAVTTNPATNVASFSATLNGSLNPRGSTTTVYFQYGLTTSYGSTTPMQTQTGNTVRAISANIGGLSASHTYHFRIVAHNAGGTAYGSDRTFTTLSATGPPVVTTNPATLIASFSATLNGLVDPHGLTTTVYFQYGTTTGYGLTTASQSKSGNTYQNVSANISGLTASSMYHFRMVATNSGGTRFGADRTFTTLSVTGPPVVITNPATLIASFSGTLNGSVDPHGLSTTVYFQYGTTTSYGSMTASQTKSGNTYQNVAANVSGLTASTTYHFRIVATNSAGTVYGSDRTLTTLSATGLPVVTTNPATNVTSSSATLNGTVDPHGLTTTVYFQYGTTTGYGHTTASQTKTGNTYQGVSANISGLSATTTYHFRIVATNSSGTVYGGDRTFTTP